jgi:hypothetical protein
MRASAVVKRQSTVQVAALRRSCQAATSSASVAASGTRRSRHCRLSTLSSISAILSPAAMFGGRVDLQLISEPLRLGGRKDVIEGAGRVGIKIIHNQHDALGVGIAHVHQLLWICCAQSRRVRCAVTSTQRRPASGSQQPKRLTTPSRSYSYALIAGSLSGIPAPCVVHSVTKPAEHQTRVGTPCATVR